MRSKSDSGRLVLVSSKPAAPGAVQREIVIDGHKYRLVPMDGDAPPPAPTLAPPAPLADAAVRGRSPASVLTARELQIVALVAEGCANKQIAGHLGISEWTVSSHLRRIYAKLDVDTRAAMVSLCFSALSERGPALVP